MSAEELSEPESNRYRIARVASSVLAVCLFVGMVVRQVVGHVPLGLAVMGWAMVAVYAVAWVLLNRRWRWRLVTGVLVWTTLAVTVASISLTGGLTGSGAVLVPMLPAVVSALLTRRGAWIATGALVLSLGVFAGLQWAGVTFATSGVPAALSAPIQGMWIAVGAVVTFAVFQHYARLNDDLATRLRAEARTDPLTGLLNRRALDERLDDAARRARRDGSWLTLLVIDIDHFKGFNDRNGHGEGDLCLKQVAACLGKHLRRGGELVARVGGEEFVGVIPVEDPATVAIHADRIRRAVQALALPRWPGSEEFVTVTVGVASARGASACPVSALFSLADEALYEGKAAGRDTVRTRVICQEVVLAAEPVRVEVASPFSLPDDPTDGARPCPVLHGGQCHLGEGCHEVLRGGKQG